jgi:hypothetical protein
VSRLPDALLVRDAWMGRTLRQRMYDGRLYEAVSVWADAEGAKEAAAAIRAKGGRARVTDEIRPWRAPPPAIEKKLPKRPCKHAVGHVRDRRMWVVWAASEKPACAGRTQEEIDP